MKTAIVIISTLAFLLCIHVMRDLEYRRGFKAGLDEAELRAYFNPSNYPALNRDTFQPK